MTTIDETTGLPELPEGYVWKVCKANMNRQFLPGTYLGRKLYVQVHKDSMYSYEPAVEVLAYASNASIRRAAFRALRKFNRKQAKSRRKDYLNEFVGTYPPKKLGA